MTRRHYCTLFDVNYLPRGLTLYRSLERVAGEFVLHIFCMDAESEAVLRRLTLPNARIVPLADLERRDPELASTKADRTQVEYCWTATPAICLYVLDTDRDVDEITYLDADLMFFADPEPLFDELGGDAVMIVPHRYAPEHRFKEPTSGTYNVEWLTFRRDDDGLGALRWWRDRCIEWCYFRHEDGKLGDQKYLDDWPERFARVHVLEHPGGGLAPWNVTAFELSGGEDGVAVDGRALVFYHYHSLRLFRPTLTARLAAALGGLRSGEPPVATPWTTNYPVGLDERRLIWDPYLRELGRSLLAARAAGASPWTGVDDLPVAQVSERLARVTFSVARRTLGRARSSFDLMRPARRRPDRFTRYRESWRHAGVASQMVELTNDQLRHVDDVPPYRAFREIVAWLGRAPDLPATARLLDIGCGVGAYGELLERWAPGRFEYVGGDYSDEILAAASSRWPGRLFERKDVFEKGALDGYDVVFASALVDVLADYEEALNALLASDARFVVLHRQRLTGAGPRVDVERGYRGQWTYRTYVSRGRLAELAQAHGRRIEAEIEVEGDVRSFVFERPGC